MMNSQNSFSILPLVVKNLLIINVVMFLFKMMLSASFGIDLDDYLGLHHWKSPLFKPYQIVTYLFMHADFGHLFFNMFAVWMFGNAVENTWGPKRFIQYYLITGFGAAILHYAIITYQIYGLEAIMSADDINNVLRDGADALSKGMNFTDYSLAKLNAYYNTPIIGASGALFGLLLAFGMLFPENKIYIYFLFPLKAKHFVIIYGAIELFSGINNNPYDNVAHFAHLGGMLFGFLMIKYWKITGNYNSF